MAGSRFRDDDYAHDINMIPLIDVMLVLLVVFLVTAPLMHSALDVQLPEASTKAAPSTQAAVVVSVGADGRYAWNERVLSWAQLSDLMAAPGSAHAQTQLQVRADKAVPFERVAQVLALAQNSGFTQITVMTAGPVASNHNP